MRARVTVLFALFIFGWLWLDARAQTGAPLVSGAHRFEKVADGIYYATASGTMNVGSNSAVIVNRDDVVIVDSHISPESGRAMLQEIKSITDKPVRVLINTHFHYDHANGNQAFPPGVEIIVTPCARIASRHPSRASRTSVLKRKARFSP